MTVSNVAALQADEPRSWSLSTAQAAAIPLGLSAAIALVAASPLARESGRLSTSLIGAGLCLAAAAGVVVVTAATRHAELRVELAVRRPHYIQALTQGSVLLYWGWFWPEAYRSLPLVGAQLLFAYAVDALLSWSRGRPFRLGFAPFPVVLSINLFLWFKPDWFYLQLLMVGLGVFAKEFIVWDKGGRKGHIFNPSSFPLAVFSLLLVVTGATAKTTWAFEIANTQTITPHIYAFIFLTSLVGQYFFGVTAMVMPAVLTVYAFSAITLAHTQTFFFPGEYIPPPVFLGAHLLFTDPATSPRTELGRILFGVLYGALVIVCLAGLRWIEAPIIFDKLIPVPLLNLAIFPIDWLARKSRLMSGDPASLFGRLRGRRLNLVYMGIWLTAFVLMTMGTGLAPARQ